MSTEPMSAAELAVPISIGRQEVQKTHPDLPTFYQTRINFGGPENPGNTVALVFGNNSTSASEQLAFAEKLVRCYNQYSAVSAMAEREAALREEVEALRAIPEKIAQGWDGCYYDDGLSEDTIGDRIRHDASRLIDAARAEAHDD